MSNCLQPSWSAAHQASLSFSISWSLLKFMSIKSVMLSSHLILCCPLLLLSSNFPNIMVFSNVLALRIGGQSTEAPASESALPINIQGWFPLGLTGLSPCSPRDSSPAPQFESMDCLVLNLLDAPTLIRIHDYWKNHSFDFTDLVRKVMSLLFNTLCSFVLVFLPRSKCL